MRIRKSHNYEAYSSYREVVNKKVATSKKRKLNNKKGGRIFRQRAGKKPFNSSSFFRHLILLHLYGVLGRIFFECKASNFPAISSPKKEKRERRGSSKWAEFLFWWNMILRQAARALKEEGKQAKHHFFPAWRNPNCIFGMNNSAHTYTQNIELMAPPCNTTQNTL